jgi:hypothetical protein
MISDGSASKSVSMDKFPAAGSPQNFPPTPCKLPAGHIRPACKLRGAVGRNKVRHGLDRSQTTLLKGSIHHGGMWNGNG